ncbi:MlaA family lipoprotein [Tranquillimonas alkanivorans]|uniref:Phospholipid-binding lipoprotein MlaA n=1 Tax=Tranquillimonas alkanivorans TaxID=441119 RepID=A0A1I5PJP1_9RHOB|nr:VacJ family lipoprotein [Tranquillimonas alkanivorans]SFP33761.1 phospholipid-binding lipoprotein MlaA [Tranquillimonas alkanivorans]
MSQPVQIARLGAALALAAFVAGCGPTTTPEGVNDVYEPTNRKVFGANQSFDSAFGGGGSGPDVPGPLAAATANLASTVQAPSHVVNDVLQGDVEDAVHNSFRFAINATLGVGGIFDPASSFGLEERENDFGRTLAVWGVDQGSYLVLPVIGPSSQRDLAGMVVDFAINPVRYTLPVEEQFWTLAVRAGDEVFDRLRYSESYDSVLYDSADPYAQARSIYLQNRNFETSGDEADDVYIDPYEDLDF